MKQNKEEGKTVSETEETAKQEISSAEKAAVKQEISSAEKTAENAAAKQEISSAEEAAGKAEREALAAAEDYKRKWYSVTAEYENYRKRTASTRAQAYAEGRADVIGKLFPIADNLDRALKSCNDEQTKKGIGMVIASFEKILEEEKIEAIDPVGEEFDAEKCEAIMAVEPQEGEKSGCVKQVFLKGYEQNGKVLRFAQVSVIK